MPADAQVEKRRREAQDLAFEAEQAIEGGDVKGGLALWERVRTLDPDSVELLTHEGVVHRGADRYAEAEASLKRAIAVARERLGGDGPACRIWWGDVETRAYMRAREELAMTYRQSGRPSEAAAEYRALLERNPPDNQGVRWVLAPMLLAAGDLDGALRGFERFARDYKDDHSEPAVWFQWALALYRARRPAEALRVLRRAFFINLYFATELLAREVRRRPIRHASNLAEPDWARRCAREHAPLWRETPGAREWLALAWDDPETARDIEEVIALLKKLDEAKQPARRRKLVEEIAEIERRDASAEFYARMGTAPPATDPLHPPGQRDEPPPRPADGKPPAEGTVGPSYREAVASGAFKAALDEARKGRGNPTQVIARVINLFRYDSKKELQEACNRVMQAWNEGVSQRPTPAASRAEEEHPGLAMDMGFEEFRDGDIDACVAQWLKVAREHPAVIDRLLCWDDPDLKLAREGIEDDLAWEYLNTTWWEDWRDALDAWTALLVFWCQPAVQRLAAGKGRRSAAAGSIAGAVGAVLGDSGAVGRAWRTVAEILHSVATFLRDCDREGMNIYEHAPRSLVEGYVQGQIIAQQTALMFAKKRLTEEQARSSSEALERTRELVRGLQERLRSAVTAPPPHREAPPSLNAPCPCGSGKKYKRCCGNKS